MQNILIRLATTADATELLAIYKPYVLEIAISFEYKVPCIKGFEKRIEKNTFEISLFGCERGTKDCRLRLCIGI